MTAGPGTQSLKDWSISRRGDEPKDFWSQSFCWGTAKLGDQAVSAVRVRFSNDGGRNYARCEAHLVYRTVGSDATRVTFAWTDDRGAHESSHVFAAAGQQGQEPTAWVVPTGRDVQTRWVEFEPGASR